MAYLAEDHSLVRARLSAAEDLAGRLAGRDRVGELVARFGLSAGEAVILAAVWRRHPQPMALSVLLDVYEHGTSVPWRDGLGPAALHTRICVLNSKLRARGAIGAGRRAVAHMGRSGFYALTPDGAALLAPASGLAP